MHFQIKFTKSPINSAALIICSVPFQIVGLLPNGAKLLSNLATVAEFGNESMPHLCLSLVILVKTTGRSKEVIDSNHHYFDHSLWIWNKKFRCSRTCIPFQRSLSAGSVWVERWSIWKRPVITWKNSRESPTNSEDVCWNSRGFDGTDGVSNPNYHHSNSVLRIQKNPEGIHRQMISEDFFNNSLRFF